MIIEMIHHKGIDSFLSERCCLSWTVYTVMSRTSRIHTIPIIRIVYTKQDRNTIKRITYTIRITYAKYDRNTSKRISYIRYYRIIRITYTKYE